LQEWINSVAFGKISGPSSWDGCAEWSRAGGCWPKMPKAFSAMSRCR
jgi:hypothetical protein